MQTQELLDRYEYTTKLQRTEIARLKVELERKDEEPTQLLAWVNGDSKALYFAKIGRCEASGCRFPGVSLQTAT